MTLLNINKLLQFAVQLETKGIKFFEKWADKAETDELKVLFLMYADEERLHKELFTKILIEHKDIDKGFETTDEYSEYFDEFANEIQFNEKEMESVKDMKGALEYAKKQELDAIIFFSNLINHVSIEHKPAIEKIILEEREHMKNLNVLQGKLKL